MQLLADVLRSAGPPADDEGSSEDVSMVVCFEIVDRVLPLTERVFLGLLVRSVGFHHLGAGSIENQVAELDGRFVLLASREEALLRSLW